MKKLILLFITSLTFFLINCGDSPTNKTSSSFENAAIIEKRWINAPSGLRLRRTPDLNGEKMGLIPHNSIVNFISEQDQQTTIGNSSGKWTQVQWKNVKGWVFGAYLSKSEIK